MLVALAVMQLTISLALLLYASTGSELPPWGGPVDVLVAFTLVVTCMLIWRAAARDAGTAELRIGHGVAAAVAALLLFVVWIYRAEVDLNVLLPGLAWRTWVVLYTLPAVLVVIRRR